jgi:hypothetical protein
MMFEGMPLGKYVATADVKINDPVKIRFRKKIVNAKVHKIGKGCIDAKANGLYYFCQNYDYKTGIWETVAQTKAYNEK